MHSRKPHLPRPLTAFLTVILAAGLHAQTPPSNATPQAGSIQPTVTPEMGDVGGKFFGHPPEAAKTKHYYIAAEPVLWNFAPEGVDTVCGKTFPPSLLLNRSSWKVRYVQYADADFTARVLPTERLGIMGPVLRGTTGEYLAVTFLNRAWLPLSMHPHGVKYDKDSEGSFYKPAPGRGAAVAPGAKFTYVWHLDEASAPLPSEPSSRAWLYHSHVTGDAETNMGLIGSIVVTDPVRARSDGTPRDVDREMAALYMIFDESNLSDDGDGDADDHPPKADPTSMTPPLVRTWAEAQGILEEGERYTINGLTFGNLPGFDMNEGEHVRWYLFGLGSEKDFHTAHWHGMTVVEDGHRRTDVVELLPASMKVVDMKADNPGAWLMHCHVAEHMGKGMFARFTVHPAHTPSVSREPEVAFFGMPQSLSTLIILRAELMPADKANEDEINLIGQVTVPHPFPVARNAFTISIGKKSITLLPDSSGVCVIPEGVLLVKNASATGIVTGGTLNFELTLKGSAWMAELKRLKQVPSNASAAGANLPLSLQVGEAHHSTSAALKLAAGH